MKLTSYGRTAILNFGRFNIHVERDMTEVSIGFYAHITRYDSAWIGIKIPFLTFEFSWDMFDEEKAPMMKLNFPKDFPQELKEEILKEMKR